MHERSCYLFGMTKGADTRLSILKAGLDMASRLGLESVTIGELAKATGMSKSGLFAHFQSKENLQIQILNFAGESFAQMVLLPALTAEAGLPRIRALVANWVNWSAGLVGGCIFVSASTEFSQRPGKVRDFIIMQQQDLVDSLSRLARSAVKAGDFRADADTVQFSFDIFSLLHGLYYYQQLFQDSDAPRRLETALERLLTYYSATQAPQTNR